MRASLMPLRGMLGAAVLVALFLVSGATAPLSLLKSPSGSKVTQKRTRSSALPMPW